MSDLRSPLEIPAAVVYKPACEASPAGYAVQNACKRRISPRLSAHWYRQHFLAPLTPPALNPLCQDRQATLALSDHSFVKLFALCLPNQAAQRNTIYMKAMATRRHPPEFPALFLDYARRVTMNALVCHAMTPLMNGPYTCKQTSQFSRYLNHSPSHTV
jgi:hypothetical protein